MIISRKILSVVMILCMLCSVCAMASAEEYADVIRIADDNQATSYDLHKDTSVNARNMLRGTVFEQLVTLKKDGSIGPELAESYEVNETNSEFVFHLRQGVHFHNGKEMTSEDVVASLNRWVENFSTVRNMLGDARFVADDPYTVSLKLQNSAIMLLDMLAGASQCAVIYPAESVAAENAETGFVPPEALIGTGPYTFAEWAVDQYVRLERFEDYAPYGDPEAELDGLWGYKHAYTKTLMYYIMKDADTRVNGLLAGDYDFAVKVTDANLARVEADPEYTLYSQQTGMISLVWNKRSTDKYLRQAVQALANADDLNIVNYGELYDVDPCFMEDGQPGWYTTAGSEYFCQNDPEKAKELLGQSSFDTSKPLRILYVNSGGAPAMVEVLKHNKPLQSYIAAQSSDKIAQITASQGVITTMLSGILIGSMQMGTILTMVGMLPSIIFAAFGAKYAGTHGSKKAIVTWTKICIGLSALTFLYFLVVHMTVGTGTIAHMGITMILYVLLTLVLNGAKMCVTTAATSFMADVIDYELDRSGQYIPAVVTGTYSLVDKLISSAGALVAGLAIAVAGYHGTARPQPGDPATNAVFWVTMIVMYLIPILGWIITLIAMKNCKLDKDEMVRVQMRIAEAKAAAKKEQE